MTIEALQHINTIMVAIGIPYSFMSWRGAVEYPYVIGEYTEQPSQLEDGLIESSFLLTVTSNTDVMSLETIKHTIESHFRHGRRAILPNGHGVAIYYDSAFPIHTGTPEFHRMQINLTMKEWRI